MKVYEGEGIFSVRTAIKFPYVSKEMPYNPNAETEFSHQLALGHDCFYEFRESAEFIALLNWDDLLIARPFLTLPIVMRMAVKKNSKAAYFSINKIEGRCSQKIDPPSMSFSEEYLRRSHTLTLQAAIAVVFFLLTCVNGEQCPAIPIDGESTVGYCAQTSALDFGCLYLTKTCKNPLCVRRKVQIIGRCNRADISNHLATIGDWTCAPFQHPQYGAFDNGICHGGECEYIIPDCFHKISACGYRTFYCARFCRIGERPVVAPNPAQQPAQKPQARADISSEPKTQSRGFSPCSESDAAKPLKQPLQCVIESNVSGRCIKSLGRARCRTEWDGIIDNYAQCREPNRAICTFWTVEKGQCSNSERGVCLGKRGSKQYGNEDCRDAE